MTSPGGARGGESTRTVRVDGADLHVACRGPSGALPVLLLHAFPLSGRMWDPQMRALSDRYRLVAPDCRGLGRSALGDGQHTMETFVDDLLAVMDELALDRPVACGLSMGGYVLLRALQRAPERFRGVVLADTRSAADDDRGKLARAEAVRALQRDGATPFAEATVERLLGRTSLEERPELAREVVDAIRANPVGGMCAAQLAMAGRTDTTAALPTLRVPTLVVVGEEDVLTPPDVAREMAALAPGARLVVLPRAGHLSSLETPDAFNRELRAFLEEVETG